MRIPRSTKWKNARLIILETTFTKMVWTKKGWRSSGEKNQKKHGSRRWGERSSFSLNEWKTELGLLHGPIFHGLPQAMQNSVRPARGFKPLSLTRASQPNHQKNLQKVDRAPPASGAGRGREQPCTEWTKNPILHFYIIIFAHIFQGQLFKFYNAITKWFE